MEILHTIEGAAIKAAIDEASQDIEKKISKRIADGCREGLNDLLSMLHMKDANPPISKKVKSMALMELGLTALACAIYVEFEDEEHP